MNIYDAISYSNKILPHVGNFIHLWRIEQAINNERSFIVPSYALASIYDECLQLSSVDPDTKLCGIEVSNPEFIHSLVLWGMAGRSIRIAPQILQFVVNTAYLEKVNPKVFYKFPSQSFYVSAQIDNFSGLLICKDYIDTDSGSQYVINISLINESGGQGKQINYVIPMVGTFNLFQDIEKHSYGKTLSKVFYLLLYILNEFESKEDLIYQKGVDYLGFYFAEKYEQNKLLDGYWRIPHWHTYLTKNEDGEENPVVKWVRPTWVAQ